MDVAPRHSKPVGLKKALQSKTNLERPLTPDHNIDTEMMDL